MTHALLIYNAMLLDESTDTPGAVLSVDGKIRSVFNGYFTNANTVSSMAKAVLLEDGYSDDCTLELFDAAGLTLTPAFIDMHVHLRYPGQPLKEDLESGTHACASGGFGTICAMPNTNPVVSSKEQAGAIMNEAKQLGYTNVIQVVSITKDFEGKDISHIDELDPARTPVISEDGREVASSEVMLNAMEKAARKGLIVACHCEDPELAAMAKPFRQHGLKTLKENNIPLDPLKIHEIGNVPFDVSESIRDDFMNANELLRTAEDTLTQRNIALAELAHAKVHLCHVSTELSIDYVRQAKKRGYTNISCEVTPHHICCSAYDWKEMLAIVNPPIRSIEDNKAIIEGIKDGTVDCISTDHAPHTQEDKEGGSPGFTGIELSYAACHTDLVCTKQISARKLSQLMSANPARIMGLNKGLLRQNYDADFTIVDPELQWKVDPNLFYSKGKWTPFTGRTLTGKVRALFLNGRMVIEQ